MGKSEKEILNDLSQQAEQFEMPVEDFVWEAIKAEVQPEKKKRGFSFWWFGGSGLLMVLMTFAAVFPSQVNNANATLNAGKAQRVISPPTNALVLFSAKPIQKQTETKKSILRTKAQNAIAPAVNSSGISLTNTMVSIPVDLNLKNSSKQKHESGAAVTTIFGSTAPNKGSISDNSTEDSLDEVVTVDSLRSIATSDIVGLTETDSTIEEQNTITEELTMTPIEKENKDRNFALLLHGGVGESFRVLKSGTHHDLITHKNEHETFGECFEIGLDAQIKLGNRFIGRTGLGYKFYSDKYNFQHDLITHKTRNDYQYLQVPLIVGFNLLPRPKSNLYLLGGLRANLLTSAQSSWVDVNALAPVAHTNASANTPFRSLTAAVNLGLDYNFSFTDKFSIHFIPSVDAFLNSVYKRKTDLNQRPYSVNIDLGISYNF